jgi:tetratricopeptide (TPR) repeat protein
MLKFHCERKIELLTIMALVAFSGHRLCLAQTASPAASDPARFEQAVEIIKQGRYDQALPILKDLALRNPHKAPVFLAMGQCYFETGQYEAAEAPLRLAAELAPGLVQGHFLLGSVLGMRGQGPETMKELREAVRLDPAFQPAYRVMGMFQVEHKQFVLEAREALEMAIKLDREDSRAYYWLGRYFQGVRNPGSARNSFETALRLQPDSIQARLGIAQALYDMGEIDSAQTEFQSVLAKEPASFGALLGRAKCLYSRREIPAALETAGEAETKASSLEEQRAALWLLSRLYRSTGQSEEAAKAEAKIKGFEKEIEEEVSSFWETKK